MASITLDAANFGGIRVGAGNQHVPSARWGLVTPRSFTIDGETYNIRGIHTQGSALYIRFDNNSQAQAFVDAAFLVDMGTAEPFFNSSTMSRSGSEVSKSIGAANVYVAGVRYSIEIPAVPAHDPISFECYVAVPQINEGSVVVAVKFYNSGGALLSTTTIATINRSSLEPTRYVSEGVVVPRNTSRVEFEVQLRKGFRRPRSPVAELTGVRIEHAATLSDPNKRIVVGAWSID